MDRQKENRSFIWLWSFHPGEMSTYMNWWWLSLQSGRTKSFMMSIQFQRSSVNWLNNSAQNCSKKITTLIKISNLTRIPSDWWSMSFSSGFILSLRKTIMSQKSSQRSMITNLSPMIYSWEPTTWTNHWKNWPTLSYALSSEALLKRLSMRISTRELPTCICLSLRTSRYHCMRLIIQTTSRWILLFRLWHSDKRNKKN